MTNNDAPYSGSCIQTTLDAPHLKERALFLDLGTKVGAATPRYRGFPAYRPGHAILLGIRSLEVNH